MSKQLHDLDEPISIMEKYMYAQVVRLDALCNMLSSLIEHIAKKDEVATTTATVVESPRKRKAKE